MVPVNGDDHATRSDLLAVARAAAASSALLAAARAADAGNAPDPQRGDLWRVTWDDWTALVVALRVTACEVLAAPLTIDPDTGDDQSLCLQPGDTVLDVPCAVWGGLTTTLPLRVFDAHLGRIESDLVAALVDLAAGAAPHSDRRTGQEISSPFDPIASDRAEVEDLMHDLAAAHWAPTGDTTATTLGALLGPAALPELPRLLGVSTAEVWEVWRGHHMLTADQAAAVEHRFDVDTSTLLEGPAPDDALVVELDHPRWRTQLRALRYTRDLGDVAVRRTAAAGAVAMAARQTGSGDGGWRARLQHYFDNLQG